MGKRPFVSRLTIWELIFQLALLLLVFVFYSYDRKKPGVEEWQVVSFLNYVWAAFFINYYLLPVFLYRKKYGLFALMVILVVTVVILLEETVIERIYFPDTRGQRFLGVFFNLAGTLPSSVKWSNFRVW
ncbi:MAG: hypothetical protein ACPF9D_02435 [Owenweeksia sp.]